jgi:hypothetical protein
MSNCFIEDYNINLLVFKGGKWDAKRMTELFAFKLMKDLLLEDDFESAKELAKDYEEFEKYFDGISA